MNLKFFRKNNMKNESVKVDYLKKPLTKQEIKGLVDDKGYIKVNILLHEDDLLYTQFNDFLDLVVSKVSECPYLNEITHKMVGCIPDKYSIIYEITADANDILEEL